MKTWTFVNKFNENKFVELRRYKDGHYYIKQYIKGIDGNNKYVACNAKQNKRGGVWHQIAKKFYNNFLNEDYELVKVSE